MIRILLLADTHLGFDYPFRPRIERRRRGLDFFHNYEKALQPALEGRVDLVVHGGDLFFRSRVPNALVDMALSPLIRVAEKNVPVFLIPGNHERSRIPLNLWTLHPNFHIFDHPRTFKVVQKGISIALTGFPFERSIRDAFPGLLKKAGLFAAEADLKLLCFHQAVEGAHVGPADYTFRQGPDVIPGREIPSGIAAVLSGHIHRTQVLRNDLNQQTLKSPVLYPGSIERTSFAEKGEDKNFIILELNASRKPNDQIEKIEFHKLPARPMTAIVVNTEGKSAVALKKEIRHAIFQLDPDSVVNLRFLGPDAEEAQYHFPAAKLRKIAPSTMNIQLSIDRPGLNLNRPSRSKPISKI
jgi:DNA repair protein SbcD/Mre11